MFNAQSTMTVISGRKKKKKKDNNNNNNNNNKNNKNKNKNKKRPQEQRYLVVSYIFRLVPVSICLDVRVPG